MTFPPPKELNNYLGGRFNFGFLLNSIKLQKKTVNKKNFPLQNAMESFQYNWLCAAYGLLVSHLRSEKSYLQTRLFPLRAYPLAGTVLYP